MSEENLNNQTEETAALFVSAQKKKQAEEEVRKKAAEEQARRDAAEAEVRKMEEEVEERRRKAEEEKKALEEKANEAAADAKKTAEGAKSVNIPKVSVDAGAIKEKIAGGKNPKLPLFIGIGAAVVVLIIIIAVVAGGGKKSIDYSSLAFDTEYAIQGEGINMTILYPGSLYSGATEEDGTVDFTPAKSKVPSMAAVTTVMANKGDFTFISAKELQNALSQGIKEQFSGEGFEVLEESATDVASDNPGKYSYRCTFKNADNNSGAATAWIGTNANGDYVLVGAVVAGKGEDTTDAVKLCELFESANDKGALMVPGCNPPASVETDGVLEADAIHMGIIAPKDQFRAVEGFAGNSCVWSDDNGASYILIYQETDVTFDDIQATNAVDPDTVQNAFKEMAQNGINKIHPGIESRMFVNDEANPNDRIGYSAEYKDVIGGVTYWEGLHALLWRDVRTQKYYFCNVILLAPDKNQDVYKGLFEKACDRLQDI